MSNKIHSVKYNFIMNFILTASQFLFPLITFPYVSRVLQATGNGKISFVTSVANYFMLVASLGVPTYGIRACAKVRDNKEELSKTAQEIFLINLIMTGLVMISYLVCVQVVPRFHEERMLFYINGINIVLNCFGMNWLFQALEQYDYITFRSIAFKAISVVLMFVLVHEQADYVVYGAIVVFAAVGSNVFNFFYATRVVTFRLSYHMNLRQHIKPILILFSQNLAISIYTNLDTVMLGFMKGDAEVGYYNAAVKVKTILVSVVTSLGNVLLPRMSYYAKNHQKEAFQDMIQKSLNFTLCMALPLTVFFVVCAKESILFLAGDGYTPSILAMQIITISVVPIGLTNILGIQVLTAVEKEKYVLLSVTAGAVVDAVLNIFFILEFGAVGASFATMVAEFLVLAIQVYYAQMYLCGIRRELHVGRYTLAAFLGGAALVALRLIGLQLPSFLFLCVACVVFGAIYGVVLLLWKDEFVMDVLQTVKKRKKQ